MVCGLLIGMVHQLAVGLMDALVLENVNPVMGKLLIL
jgi:hypothetical protein